MLQWRLLFRYTIQPKDGAMKLTDKHERHLTRYLREVEERLTSLPEKDRVRTVQRLQANIRNDLSGLTKDVPSDKQMESVLSRYGTPTAAAAELLRSANGGKKEVATQSEDIWLGVCRWIADQAELAPWMIRTAFVVLALIFYFTPFVLITYIAIWATLYFRQDPDQRPEIAWRTVAERAIAALAIAVCLYTGARAAIWFTYWAPTRLIEGGRPVLTSDWTWLERDNGWYMFWAAAIALPLAILSALPVREDWKGTLLKLSQTTLALYGAAIAVGLAYIIVALILAYVSQYTGMDIMTTIRDLMAG
jgi:phage shock protein PspC (stress-responsive transcriptional regulator)